MLIKAFKIESRRILTYDNAIQALKNLDGLKAKLCQKKCQNLI